MSSFDPLLEYHTRNLHTCSLNPPYSYITRLLKALISNNSNVGQSWSKWNWYLLRVGQNGTDICLKFQVKVGKLW
jgi:hypothetical protein